MNKRLVIAEIIRVGRLLYDKDFTYATNGNISVRYRNGILITATDRCKGELNAKDIVTVSRDGRAGRGSPSIELNMHLGIYRNRTDINAVILAHPFFTNLIGIQPGTLNLGALPNMEEHLKKVEFIPNIAPGTKELAQAVVEAVKKSDIVVIHRYGTVTTGAGLTDALYRLERLEYLARFLVYKQIIF